MKILNQFSLRQNYNLLTPQICNSLKSQMLSTAFAASVVWSRPRGCCTPGVEGWWHQQGQGSFSPLEFEIHDQSNRKEHRCQELPTSCRTPLGLSLSLNASGSRGRWLWNQASPALEKALWCHLLGSWGHSAALHHSADCLSVELLSLELKVRQSFDITHTPHLQ